MDLNGCDSNGPVFFIGNGFQQRNRTRKKSKFLKLEQMAALK